MPVSHSRHLPPTDRPDGGAPDDGPAPAYLPPERLIAHLAQAMGDGAAGPIVHIETLEAREPTYGDPDPPLPDLLQKSLQEMGIQRLYTHQVEAIDHVRHGRNVVVVTATSSGKTLCYNLPVLERILIDRDARAIYLYPINALVNDQLKSLFRLNVALGRDAVGVARYTGSLSSERRKAARARDPNIWLTNPEMLHLSFLLWHQNWEELWRNLRYVVIDEVHTYRGVFGANMAHLLRRVLRMAAHYGAEPQFICCSATIANPQELAENLTGRPFAVVDQDGAGRGRRYFVLWNPPLQGDGEANLRRSYVEESVDLLLLCVRANYNTIVFARARSLTERMLRVSRSLPSMAEDGSLIEQLSSYRAGYMAEEREEIEARLRAGDIRGIITTNALEMGIDIGGLDAAIISGYPGTIMSTWQQAGRAGRRGRDSLVVMVASQNPLDQYYISHPREFFAQPHERAMVDLDNQHIRLKHLLCAARELPLLPDELARMSDQEHGLVDELVRDELLVPCDGEAEGALTYPQSRREIHLNVSLRAASHETYRILDEQGNEIGSIEPPNVFREAHPGAIYQHGGDDYRVTFLDRQRKVVRVREEHVPHYTRATSSLTLHVDTIYASREVHGGAFPYRVALGEVLIEERIRGYQELRLGSDEMVRRVNLDYPLVIRLHTTAMWILVPPALRPMLEAIEPPAPATDDDGQRKGNPANAPSSLDAALHAAQHLMTGVMPLLVMCDRRDVDGFFHSAHPDVGAAAVFVYDAYEGGIGLAEVAYERVTELLALAYDIVAACPCRAGCPSCIQSGVCRLRNEALSKPAAIAMLAALTRDAAGRPVISSSIELPGTFQGAGDAAGSGDRSARAGLGRARALQELVERTRRRGAMAKPSAWLEAPAEPEPTDRVAPPADRTPVTPQFAKGDWVELSPYGRGLVLASHLDGPREIITVRFAHRGVVRQIDATRSAVKKV